MVVNKNVNCPKITFISAAIVACILVLAMAFCYSNPKIEPSPFNRVNVAENKPNSIFPQISGLDSLKNVKITYSTNKNRKRCEAIIGRRILINYASNCCYTSQPLNCQTGLETGGFDVCISFTDQSIDDDFKSRHAKILSTSPGAGLWAWKPYIIFRTMMAMNEDDVVMYSDSGCKIIDNMDLGHICLQAEWKQDIVTFTDAHPDYEYSKADAFVIMGCDFDNCSNTDQSLGSPILMRKTFRSIQFVSEWLTYSHDYRIIGNEPSILKDEDPRFKANRNDQTILSLLSKKWKISPWPDPSQWGEKTAFRQQQKFESIAKTFMSLTRDKS